MDLGERGCALHQRVQQISATLSSCVNQMREPREYENPLCAEIGGDFWFPDKDKESVSYIESQYAKSICKRCTHRTECAEWGIHKEQYGIWGGLAPRERLAVRRQRRINLGGDEEVA